MATYALSMRAEKTMGMLRDGFFLDQGTPGVGRGAGSDGKTLDLEQDTAPPT